jgi:hypothetical protein
MAKKYSLDYRTNDNEDSFRESLLQIDREKQSYDYPEWIVDMYSNPTELNLEEEIEQEAFLFEEYWQGHIEAYLYHEDMGDR